jgi:hypothetical protein
MLGCIEAGVIWFYLWTLAIFKSTKGQEFVRNIRRQGDTLSSDRLARPPLNCFMRSLNKRGPVPLGSDGRAMLQIRGLLFVRDKKINLITEIIRKVVYFQNYVVAKRPAPWMVSGQVNVGNTCVGFNF